MANIEIIRRLCKENKISISKLETELGYSNGSIAKTSNMSADRLKQIADYFDVTMEYLITGELLNNSLGNKIKRYRIMNDLSQADLGKKLFTSGACISSWERGRTEPSLEQIKAIAEIFNIPVEDFISTAGQTNDITTDELDIIYAYRNASPEIKGVINKLLKYSKRINELDKLLK